MTDPPSAASFKSTNWSWLKSEPTLRRLQQLLVICGLGLLFKLAWVLVTPGDHGPAPLRFERAERCVEAPTPVEIYQRKDIAGVLYRPRSTDANSETCHFVTLPHYETTEALKILSTDVSLTRAWFNVSYVVPLDWPPGEQLLVYAPRIMGSAWQARIKGQAVADNLDNWRMTWNHPVVARLQPDQFQPGQTLQIEIAVAYVSHVSQSISRILVGPASTLGRSLALREYLQFIMPQACSVVMLALGTFFFAFWCVRRQEKSHLLLALASIAWGVCNLQYVLPRHDDPALEGWYASIVNLSVSWYMWLVYLFAIRFDTRRIRWVEYALPLYVFAMSALALPLWGGVFSIEAGAAFQLINTGVAAAVTLLIGKLALQGGGIELKIISATLLIALLTGVHDVALVAQFMHPESLYLLPYSGLLVYGSFLFAVQRRYVHAINAHEHLSASLKQQLAQREAELNENHLQLRKLEQAQTLATERQRLMRDMHDGLGSALTSSLAVVERGQANAAEMALMLRECVDDLRAVIDSLEPLNNDLMVLLATLRFRIGQRLQVTGINLEWSVQELPPLAWMGPPEILQVMRIVQEALSNVVKHARASWVRLTARQLGSDVEICIEDDGCGFSASSLSSGRGLRFLQQRSVELEGSLRFESLGDKGTCMRLTLPIFKPDPSIQ
jgi:signal transduction histidine kinase